MEDFSTVMQSMHEEVSEEFAKNIIRKVAEIKCAHPELSKKADSCLKGLTQAKPTLLNVLAAVYMLNGGVALKYQESEGEFEALIDGLESTPDDELDEDSIWGEMDKLDLSLGEVEGKEDDHRLSSAQTSPEKTEPKPRKVVVG